MGDARRKIDEFIKCIDTLLQVYEECSTLANASENTLKCLFKIAWTVETCYTQMQEQGCLDMVQVAVLDHWKIMGRSDPDDLSVFEEASDLVLCACFHCRSLSEESVCFAVREYISYCSNERFEKLLRCLIEEGVTCELLLSLSRKSPSLPRSIYLGWKRMMNWGQSGKIQYLLASSLQRKPANVSTVLKMVCVADDDDDDDDDDTNLKSLIVDVIVLKMKEDIAAFQLKVETEPMSEIIEKSEVIHSFPFHVSNSTEASLLLSVSKHYPRFLTVLLDSFQFLASGAEWQCLLSDDGSLDYKWKNLNFPLNVLKHLCFCDGHVGSRMRSWLAMLQKRPGCSLWQDVATCIGL